MFINYVINDAGMKDYLVLSVFIEIYISELFTSSERNERSSYYRLCIGDLDKNKTALES